MPLIGESYRTWFMYELHQTRNTWHSRNLREADYTFIADIKFLHIFSIDALLELFSFENRNIRHLHLSIDSYYKISQLLHLFKRGCFKNLDHLHLFYSPMCVEKDMLLQLCSIHYAYFPGNLFEFTFSHYNFRKMNWSNISTIPRLGDEWFDWFANC